MRITGLRLKDIGVFIDETIEFPEKIELEKAEVHILTGVNGSGKSTILHTISSISQGWGKTITSKNYIFRKCRRDALLSYFMVEFDFGELVSMTIDVNTKNHVAHGSNEIISEFFKSLENYEQEQYSFAMFAYSGYRNVLSPELNNLQDLTINPFQNSLDFYNSITPEWFGQWVANLKGKEALAYQKNDTKKVDAYRKNIRIIEKLISEVVGKAVEFELEYEPFELLVKMDNQSLPLDVLPDGLKSIVSWIGDLLMRMDLIPWIDDTPILEREFILFLDEIEVHLHPAWQRKILPVVQRMFPNAQIFISAHSPFVVGSVDNAWVHKLVLENGNAKVQSTTLSSASKSYELVLNEIFDIKEEFGEEVEQEFRKFYALRDKMQSKNFAKKKDFEEVTQKLLNRQSIEIQSIIGRELRQLERQVGYIFPQLA